MTSERMCQECVKPVYQIGESSAVGLEILRMQGRFAEWLGVYR